MGINQETMDSAAVFKLLPDDIDHLYRRSGLSGNSMAGFIHDPELASTPNGSEHFMALAGNSNFSLVAKLVLEPDLRIEFVRGGNATPDEDFFLYRINGNRSVLAQFTNDAGEILLALFRDVSTYVDWWAELYAASGMGSYPEVFPEPLPTEALICALHSIDIYRRAYMESMLDYSGNLGLTISMADFIDLIKRSSASGDKRWLLPNLFELTSGIKTSNISLKPKHIDMIAQLGFLSNENGLLTLGERSRLMGTEFISSWMGNLGFQALALVNGEVRSLSRVFLITTAFANHLCSFENAAHGESRFRHQALDTGELKKALVAWLQALQNTLPSSQAAASQPATSPPPAAAVGEEKRFCGNCGSPTVPGRQFCGTCGNPL